jgi:hypothetical protein
MDNDIERLLKDISPLGAPPELRPRVLAAVADELRCAPPLPSRRSYRPALLTAAALVASVALNLWVNDRIDRRLTVAFGPQLVRTGEVKIPTGQANLRELSEGKFGNRRLADRAVHHDTAHEYVVRLQHMIDQITNDFKETVDETPGKNSQLDRDRRGSRGRHRSGIQRFLDLADRITA